ncbi:MAG: M20 family metallopeptidase [Synergistales bacterium]|nr:M20 family metallopeptidase [Synergistales bacterium]
MSRFERIKDAVSEAELVALLRRLIEIPSHSGTPGREGEIARYVQGFLAAEGVECRLMPVLEGRSNVLARIPGEGGGTALMLNGHIDTVPPYNMEEPFSATVENGTIRGRGACDMKSGAAAMMMTLVAFRRTGIRLAGDLVFTAVINEELKSEGTEEVIRRGIKADFAIVGEPTDLTIGIGHRGLEWLDIEIKGRTAHGGTPEQGVNAISKAAAFIRAVEDRLIPKLAGRSHPVVGASTLNLGTIRGGDQPSSVAGRCHVQIDRRPTPGETLEQVLGDFRELLDQLAAEDPEFSATLRRNPDNMATMDHLPVFVKEDSPLVVHLKEAILETTGAAAEISVVPGWTDASLLQNFGGIPALNLGPGSIKNAHTEWEFVPVAELVQAMHIYAGTALRLCG